MFEWIRKQFGEGKIRFEMITADGRRGTGTVTYTGDINTLDAEEFKQDMIRRCWVDKGERVREVKIVGYY